MAIDPVPVLTETGGGTGMALYDGMSAETTAELAGTWCGNLLEITDTRPNDYGLMHCCFAEAWWRAKYLHRKFGEHDEGLVLKDRSGNLFDGIKTGLFFPIQAEYATFFVQAVKSDDEVRYAAVPSGPRGV